MRLGSRDRSRCSQPRCVSRRAVIRIWLLQPRESHQGLPLARAFARRLRQPRRLTRTGFHQQRALVARPAARLPVGADVGLWHRGALRRLDAQVRLARPRRVLALGRRRRRLSNPKRAQTCPPPLPPLPPVSPPPGRWRPTAVLPCSLRVARRCVRGFGASPLCKRVWGL